MDRLCLRHWFLSLEQAAPYLSGLIRVGSGLLILAVMLREMIAFECGGHFETLATRCCLARNE